MVLANLGVAAHGRGDFVLARSWHERSLAARRARGSALGVVRSLRDLGIHAGSVAFYRECLALLGERGDLRVVVDALEGAALTAAWHRPERAAQLLGAAEVMREQFDATFVVPADWAARERASAVVRAAPREQGFQAALSAGHGLTLASATAEVQVMSPPAGVVGEVDHEAANLSVREDQVLRLLVAEQPDRETAEKLCLSMRTVERHTSRIFANLGVRARAAAVSAALAAGLVEPDTPTTT